MSGFCGLCGDYVKLKEKYGTVKPINEASLNSTQKAEAKIQLLDYYILLCKTCVDECASGQSKSYACQKKQGTKVTKARFYQQVAMLEKAREIEKLNAQKNAFASNYYKVTNKQNPNLVYLNNRLPNVPKGF